MWEYFSTVLILILVILLAYFTTVFIAKYANGNGVSSHMQLIDRLVIDRNTSIVIVKIEDHYQVLVIGQNCIENLGVLASLDEANVTRVSFAERLKGVMNKEEGV